MNDKEKVQVAKETISDFVKFHTITLTDKQELPASYTQVSKSSAKNGMIYSCHVDTIGRRLVMIENLGIFKINAIGSLR